MLLKPLILGLAFAIICLPVEKTEGQTPEPQKCYACEGKGKTSCEDCKGSGSEICIRCSGSGRVGYASSEKCPSCKGCGHTLDTCTSCLGTGKQKNFFGKEKKCEACNGFGGWKKACSKCDSSGLVICSKCKGTGKY